MKVLTFVEIDSFDLHTSWGTFLLDINVKNVHIQSCFSFLKPG